MNVSVSTLATAVVMRCFSSFKLTGSGGKKTLPYIDLQKKKSQGVKSVHLGGQNVSDIFSSVARPI